MKQKKIRKLSNAKLRESFLNAKIAKRFKTKIKPTFFYIPNSLELIYVLPVLEVLGTKSLVTEPYNKGKGYA